MTDTPSYSAKAREIYEHNLELGKSMTFEQFVEAEIDRLAKALEQVGTEREAIGYEKGKEEAAN